MFNVNFRDQITLIMVDQNWLWLTKGLFFDLFTLFLVLGGPQEQKVTDLWSKQKKTFKMKNKCPRQAEYLEKQKLRAGPLCYVSVDEANEKLPYIYIYIYIYVGKKLIG